MHADPMTLQDIGIAISAIGSIVLMTIQVARFRLERSHLVVRLSVGTPDPENRESAYVTAAVFNRGRPAFIDGMWLHVGKDEWWLGTEAEKGKELPIDLATGRSYRVSFDLQGFEIDVENESHVFGFMVTYKEEDLAKMRLRVTDGEGHDHWTGLTKDSVPNVRAIINERTRRKEERRAGKDPDGRA